MVSGLNTADTSKEGASLRNDICEYLWFKNNNMRTVRMSSFDIVMQLLVCKILLICLILGDEKTKKISVNLLHI